jgi:hypothetical protein
MTDFAIKIFMNNICTVGFMFYGPVKDELEKFCSSQFAFWFLRSSSRADFNKAMQQSSTHTFYQQLKR